MGDGEHMFVASWIYFHVVCFNENPLSWVKATFENLLELTSSRNPLELSFLVNKNICLETFLTYSKSFFNLFIKYNQRTALNLVAKCLVNMFCRIGDVLLSKVFKRYI